MEKLELSNNFQMEKQPKRILEIGTGFRSIVDFLAHGGKDIGYSIVSDVDSERIDSHTDLTKLVANARNLPFKDGTFDYVVAMNFFGDVRVVNQYNFEATSALFSELSRVLVSGGEVCIIETYTPDVANKNLIFYKQLYEMFFTLNTKSSFVSENEMVKETYPIFRGENHFVIGLRKKDNY